MRHRRERGIATVVAIFSLLILVMLCLLAGTLMATGSEEARSSLRAKQTFYLSDSGTAIAKQLLTDNGTAWRPWTGTAYACPANWTGGANNSSCHYCAVTMTVGGSTGTIKVYVCQSGTTTGDSSAPCTDAPGGSDVEALGLGTVSGA